MYNVFSACVRIEDERRYNKKGGVEKARSRPGNETAGGIHTKFTRNRSRDVFHERHIVRMKKRR